MAHVSRAQKAELGCPPAASACAETVRNKGAILQVEFAHGRASTEHSDHAAPFARRLVHTRPHGEWILALRCSAVDNT